MVVQQFEFPSNTGEGIVKGRLYQPAFVLPGNTGLLLQVIHGMADHMARYDSFCRYLAEKGIMVCIHDLAGHGQTAPSMDKLGYFSEKDGISKILLDIDQVYKLSEDYLNHSQRNVKSWNRLIFGHSFGSFIARSYCAKPGVQLEGAIYSGTSGKNPIVGIGLLLTKLSMWKNGSLYRDSFLDKLSQNGNLKRIPNPRTKFDWLTRNTSIVDAYVADPLCGFTFTTAGFLDLGLSLKQISSRKWAEQVPADLPILIISGDQDPTGDYGKGPRQVQHWLKQTNHLVDLKIMPGCRHEILNETNQMEVWQIIADWLLTGRYSLLAGKEGL